MSYSTGLPSEGWFKSSHSSNNSDICVEARFVSFGAQVRDSKDRAGAVLSFATPRWASFIERAKGGGLDSSR